MIYSFKLELNVTITLMWYQGWYLPGRVDYGCIEWRRCSYTWTCLCRSESRECSLREDTLGRKRDSIHQNRPHERFGSFRLCQKQSCHTETVCNGKEYNIAYQDHKKKKEDARIKYVLTLKFLQVYGTFCFEVLVWVDTWNRWTLGLWPRGRHRYSLQV